MKTKKRCMKGSGEALNALMLIIIMIGLFAIVIVAVNGTNNKVQRLIYDEALTLRMRNVFELTQASLDVTWRVSTVQAIFKTADSGVRCGSDESGRYLLADRYWYQYDPTITAGRDGTKTSSCVDVDQCDPGRTDKEARIPGAEKYNNGEYNPRICYPRNEDLVDALETFATPYKAVPARIDVQAVTVNVEDSEFAVDAQDEQITNRVCEGVRA